MPILYFRHFMISIGVLNNSNAAGWLCHRILCNAAAHATQAAIILAPGANCGADEIIRGIGGMSRDGLPQLTENNTIWRYQVLCHELGHIVAGIEAEAEADKIGSLCCRRAFPSAREPVIQADMRVLDAVYKGYLLCERGIRRAR